MKHIGVMAPSSAVNKDKLMRAVEIIKARGHDVLVHPQTFLRDGEYAGTPQQKADAFHELQQNSAIDFIWAARGGYGAGDVLPLLDKKLCTKPLVGFSDVTAWLSYLGGIHAPIFENLENTLPEDIDGVFDALDDKKFSFSGVGVHFGTTQGRLIGGNLSVLCSLLGTPYQPDFKGKILFLEDCNETLEKIHRLFSHLRNAMVLDDVAGIVLGDFNIDDIGTHFDTILKMIVTYPQIPVMMSSIFGHHRKNFPMKINSPVGLRVSNERAVLFSV